MIPIIRVIYRAHKIKTKIIKINPYLLVLFTNYLYLIVKSSYPNSRSFSSFVICKNVVFLKKSVLKIPYF